MHRFFSNEEWVISKRLIVNYTKLDSSERGVVRIFDEAVDKNIPVWQVEECYLAHKIIPSHNGGRVAAFILEYALLHQNLPLVQFILNKQPHLVNAAGSYGVFIINAAQISFSFFQEFTSRGANINLANESGFTSLHALIIKKNPDLNVLMYLFMNNARIYSSDLIVNADTHAKVEKAWNLVFGHKENKIKELVFL